MECRKCKKEIPADFAFCNFCGAKQEAPKHGVKRRGNGQGTVYKTASSWACEITLGYTYTDGKRKRVIRRKKGFKTKKDAVLYLETLRNAPEKQKFITLSELWELFKKTSVDLSKSKKTAYRIAWKKIEQDVSYRAIDSFSVPELQDITDNCAPSYYTRRDIKNLLSHFYKLAIRDDYVDKNKAQYIKLPKLETNERDIFTQADNKLLWADYNATKSAISGQMLVMLYTGIRPGELLTIRTGNVYPAEHYMTGGIKSEKGKNRKIILPDKIIPIIHYLLATAQDDLIAYYKNSNDFYDAWQEKRSQLKISESLTPYCCRHTYITRLTALKVSPAMLQELAGHEDYDTTLEYTHLSIGERLAEVNRLD